MVDALREFAERHGAEIRSHARVSRVETSEQGVLVQLSDQTAIPARAVILAVGSREACELLDVPDSDTLAGFARCLDLALDRLSRPDVGFAF